jgi:ATP-dependent Clp protease adaptor protein ClpS
MAEIAEPKSRPKPSQKTKIALEPGWKVVVWNDPINLMSYVVYVFQRVLGFDQRKARKHMMEVHERGKSVVAQASKEKAELYWQRIQQFGLKVTLERD